MVCDYVHGGQFYFFFLFSCVRRVGCCSRDFFLAIFSMEGIIKCLSRIHSGVFLSVVNDEVMYVYYTNQYSMEIIPSEFNPVIHGWYWPGSILTAGSFFLSKITYH